jgi:hypothetical protein
MMAKPKKGSKEKDLEFTKLIGEFVNSGETTKSMVFTKMKKYLINNQNFESLFAGLRILVEKEDKIDYSTKLALLIVAEMAERAKQGNKSSKYHPPKKKTTKKN